MEFEKLVLLLLLNSFHVLRVESSRIAKRQASSQYYLAYCPVRQGNYITYSGSLCYCRRGGQQYDCRPAGNASTNTATQRPTTGRPVQATRPVQAATLPPLRPPPVAPPPPPPPNRPSTPPNVDTRPGVLRQLTHNAVMIVNR
ncbi:hypothetical protein GE061_016434 [Apolygus lucorum]|uniref:EGF-like domain-containing protein n=1 Tax=Apolygus lucorum TaxID=248454 RepID=A0A8S9XK81_APOLU|nr:hypothetical protein GE061_016434 [Apolygus lucorum]